MLNYQALSRQQNSGWCFTLPLNLLPKCRVLALRIHYHDHGDEINMVKYRLVLQVFLVVGMTMIVWIMVVLSLLLLIYIITLLIIVMIIVMMMMMMMIH